MADEPRVCDSKPLVLVVEAGVHFWCSCGLSSHQPFCDGSHKGSAFQPVKLLAEKSETLWLCGCKRTAAAPRCDGSHKQLPVVGQ